MPSSTSVAVAAERDHVARPEDQPSVGVEDGHDRLLPALIEIGVESVELTPSETVSRACTGPRPCRCAMGWPRSSRAVAEGPRDR